MGITPKQKEELNDAIYYYLLKHKYNTAAEAFREDAQI